MDELAVFTDGGCSGNPGPGGWGFVIVHEGGPVSETVGSGGEAVTTNNRMELSAVIEALRTVNENPLWKDCTVAVYTDSQYVQKGISQWIAGWKKNGWKTSSKEPVKNQDLWQILDRASAERKPRWVWVKGHAGNHYNEICDQLTQVEIGKFKR